MDSNPDLLQEQPELLTTKLGIQSPTESLFPTNTCGAERARSGHNHVLHLPSLSGLAHWNTWSQMGSTQGQPPSACSTPTIDVIGEVVHHGARLACFNVEHHLKTSRQVSSRRQCRPLGCHSFHPCPLSFALDLGSHYCWTEAITKGYRSHLTKSNHISSLME